MKQFSTPSKQLSFNQLSKKNWMKKYFVIVISYCSKEISCSDILGLTLVAYKCAMDDRESFYVRQKCRCSSLEFYVKKGLGSLTSNLSVLVLF